MGRRWSTEEINILKTRYSKAKLEELVSLLPTRTAKQITSKANKLGIVRRTIKTWDNDYFSTPNVSNCYWAGLLAADGNIAHTKGQSRITISLSATDRETLVSLKDEIHYDGELQEYSTQNDSNMIRLGLSCDQWATDLNRHWNITSKKSKTLQPPNINDIDLVKSYITGYIDGDGSWTSNGKYLRQSIAGTEEMLMWIAKYANQYANTSNYRLAKPYKHSNSDVWVYAIRGSRAIAFADWLLTVDVPRMIRKWSVIDSYR